MPKPKPLNIIPADDLLSVKTDDKVHAALSRIIGKISIAMMEASQKPLSLRELKGAYLIVNKISELHNKSPEEIMQNNQRFEKDTVGWALQRLESYMPELNEEFALLRKRFVIEDKGYELSYRARQQLRSFSLPVIEGFSAG
jgi:hypothetical protein